MFLHFNGLLLSFSSLIWCHSFHGIFYRKFVFLALWHFGVPPYEQAQGGTVPKFYFALMFLTPEICAFSRKSLVLVHVP